MRSLAREALILVGGIAVGAVGYAFIGGPRSLDDCILQKIKPGLSTEAVQALQSACYSKFPPAEIVPEAPETRELVDSELRLLNGRGGVSVGNTFDGELYNGNEGLTVTELEVAVTVEGDTNRSPNRYRTAYLSVSPLTTGSFSFEIIPTPPGKDWGWHITKARGTPVATPPR